MGWLIFIDILLIIVLALMLSVTVNVHLNDETRIKIKYAGITIFSVSPEDEKQKKLFTWLSPLPPILANAVIIPPVLKYAYGILPMWFSVITVTAGEIISCGIFGLILLAALKKYKNQLFPV